MVNVHIKSARAKYIVANNVTGVKRTLKHNAFIYSTNIWENKMNKLIKKLVLFLGIFGVAFLFLGMQGGISRSSSCVRVEELNLRLLRLIVVFGIAMILSFLIR